jgi:hypothetical protein
VSFSSRTLGRVALLAVTAILPCGALAHAETGRWRSTVTDDNGNVGTVTLGGRVIAGSTVKGRWKCRGRGCPHERRRVEPRGVEPLTS